MIKCNLCGKELDQISHTHLKAYHGITTAKYRELFPGARFFSEEQIENRKIINSRPSVHKGKTYEEIYGVEKAAKLREFHRNFHSKSGGHCLKWTVCDRCGKTINNRRLKAHVDTHLRDDLLPPKMKLCLVCNKSYDAKFIGRVTPICDYCWEHLTINEQNNYARTYSLRLPETREKMSIAKKKSLMENPESHPSRIIAGAGLGDNPSYPQRCLYDIILEKYKSEINYPVNTGKTVRYLDVAIINKKFDFEYDGEYFHNDLEKDLERDNELIDIGWIVYHVRGWDEIYFVRDNLEIIIERGESRGADAIPLVASRVKV